MRALIGWGSPAFIPNDSPAVILQAVRLVLAGGTYAPLRLLSDPMSGSSMISGMQGQHARLTPRQRRSTRPAARGLPNKRIARELGLSESTVKVHFWRSIACSRCAIEPKR